MGKNNLLKKCLFGLVLCCFGILFTGSSDASAAMTTEELYLNAVYNNMKECYLANGVFREEILINDMDIGEPNYYEGLDSLFYLDNAAAVVRIPTKIGRNNNLGLSTEISTSVPCTGLFMGTEVAGDMVTKLFGTMEGIVSASGKNIPSYSSSSESKIDFLKTMGYYIPDEGSSGKNGCIKVEYRFRDGTENSWQPLETLCWPQEILFANKDYTELLDDLGRNIIYRDQRGDFTQVYFNGGDFYNKYISNAMEGIDSGNCAAYYPMCAGTISNQAGFTVQVHETCELDDCESNGGIVKILEMDLYRENMDKIKNFNNTPADQDTKEFMFRYSYFEEDSGETVVPAMKLEHTTETYLRARQALSGQTEEAVFTDSDKYNLYIGYIQSVYGIKSKTNCTQTKPESPVIGNSFEIYTTSEGWCEVLLMPENLDIKVSGFKNDSNKYLDTEYDAEGLVRAMWALNPDSNDIVNVTLEQGVAPNDGSGEGSESPTGDVDPCQNNAGSLAWVVCPVMKGIGNALEWAYKGAVEPLLVVNSQEFFNGADSPARQAWSIMVGFANSAMIIFLIVIIFSQLTGVGIDNYGIKKSLPKILVAAVLINLSFILCQVLVEVSNICGRAFYNLFDSIKIMDSVSINGVTIEGISSAEKLFSVLFSLMCGGMLAFGVAEVAQIFGSGTAVSSLVIPVLLALLVAIIAILFFFVIVGLRKAGVVMLVIISPIAVLCYMLPNTKKYFDKWLKAFEGLLFVYPICGLLLGGSQFLAKVILRIGAGSNDFLMYFVGSMLLVVPYFFVPSLIKGSFAAMGNIGAKISSLGRGLSKGTTGRIKGTDAYKNMQRIRGEKTNQFKAGRKKNGELRATGKLKNRLARSKVGQITGYDRLLGARMAADDKAASATTADRASLVNAATESLAPNVREEKLTADLSKACENGNSAAILATTQAIAKSGLKKSKQAEILRKAIPNLSKGMSVGQRSSLATKILENHGDMVSKDFELEQYLMNGMNKEDKFSGNRGEYLGQLITGKKLSANDIDLEKLEKQSAKNVAMLASAGLISRGVAQEYMANMPAGTESAVKIVIGAVADGVNLENNIPEDLYEDAVSLTTPNPDRSKLSTSLTNVSDEDANRYMSAQPKAVNIVQSKPDIQQNSVVISEGTPIQISHPRQQPPQQQPQSPPDHDDYDADTSGFD